MFAKVENRVTKSCQFFRRKNRKKQFWPEIFRFYEQDRLLCARVDIGVTESPTKTAKKEEEKNLGLRFFFKSGRAQSRFAFSVGNFLFLAAEKQLFWGGV